MGNHEFKKKFGQNFLKDESLLTEIVKISGIMSDDVVVEIGAGMGALTSVLSKFAKKVYSFEIDSDLFEFLENKFLNTNVQFVFEDIMNFCDEKLNQLVGGHFKLVANLPYYVTSPIITRFLKNKNMDSLTVMVQEEVADRIIAKPKSKDYGVLTIICSLFGEPEKALRVNRSYFTPVPKVDSAVIKIERKDPEFEISEKFISFIKQAFSMRRKKLSSNLSWLVISKPELESLLTKLGHSSEARAEELSLSEFKELYELIYDKML